MQNYLLWCWSKKTTKVHTLLVFQFSFKRFYVWFMAVEGSINFKSVFTVGYHHFMCLFTSTIWFYNLNIGQERVYNSLHR